MPDQAVSLKVAEERMMNDSTRFVRWPRRASRPAARVAAAVMATAGLALLATACGGSPGAHVAQLGSTATQPASSSGPSNAGGSTSSRSAIAQPLAFSHCMRSHGVPKFPDSNSGGVWPKSQVELAAGNPRFQTATQTCGHLLPDGGPGVPPSPAVVQLIQSDMLEFARCMRSHGVPNWPDPTLDRGRAIFNPEAVEVNPNSPRISTKMHECERVFPASLGIPPGA
jgi:hypothetical protein